MRIRVILGMMAVMLLGFCSGCGAKLPEMSAEQERIVVEYAAQALLHHMKDYESRLVDLSLYEEKTEEKTEEGGMDPVADTPVTDISETPETEDGETAELAVSLQELLMPEGITLSYTGFQIADHYPEGSNPVFVLDADSGKKLLVMLFAVSNQSDAAVQLDLLSAEARGEVVFADGTKSKVLSTLLLEDLFTCKEEIEAGGSREFVLIAEVGEDALEMEGATLKLYRDTGYAELSLE